MVTEINPLARITLDHKDHKGEPCRICGEPIKVYSRSGLCRKCWHDRRGKDKPNTQKPPKKQFIVRFFCHNCGTPLEQEGLCLPCMEGNTERLTKYRVFYGVAEHRYVYGQLRELNPYHVVHHLNGLKGDNRIENLCSMPREGHDTKNIVHELQRRIRELEGR